MTGSALIDLYGSNKDYNIINKNTYISKILNCYMILDDRSQRMNIFHLMI